MGGKSKDKAIGIDLGTTYSCVGAWQHDRVEIIVNDQGNRTTPSMVAFTSNERLVGDAAMFQISNNYHNTVFDVKRIIGRKFTDASVEADMKLWPFTIVSGKDGNPMIEVDYKGQKKLFKAEEISSMVLSKMRMAAQQYLMCDVKNAVITVPAYFNDAQKRATRDACKIAGLNVMRIINEPTAAAICYCSGGSMEKKRNVVIFDLGGGTFDVSVVRVEKHKIEVKAVSGDTHLGGEDFNNRMLDYCVQLFNKKYKMDMSKSAKALRKLRSECERAKRNLSWAVETVIEIDCLYQKNDFYVQISRAKFEELNADLFQKCITILQQCLKNAGMSKEQLSDIVLVGGSSRIPKVQELLTEFFQGKYPCKSVNPDEAVAYGATVQAAFLNKEEVNLVVVDVTPFSLGIETCEGIMNVVVPRNTCIPTRNEMYITTLYDNSTVIKIPVYEGERRFTVDNNFLAEFILTGIPPAIAGVPYIIICFLVDSDGILTVSAQETRTRIKNQILISEKCERPRKEKVDRMVADAQRLRREDKIEEELYLAKFELNTNICNMKTRVTEAMTKGNIEKRGAQNMIDTLNASKKWLEDNQSPDLDKLQQKLKELKVKYKEAMRKKKFLKLLGF